MAVSRDAVQPTLFGSVDPEPDRAFAGLVRVEMDHGAWVEYVPGWLAGDQTLFDVLEASTSWSQPEVHMYDRKVLTPRLVAPLAPPHHPVIEEMCALLSDRYGVALDRVSLGYYRNGEDSVAWHGDRIARERHQALVATVSLGGRRRFLMKPTEGGASRRWDLGHGDLFVMGGTAQRTWRHGVPKVARAAPRIAVMFRHAYD